MMPIPMSGTPDIGDSLGRQDLASDCDRDRGLRAATRAWTGPPACRHGPGAGDFAALPARGPALAQVHALLVGMLRGHPDLILDSCSVRAKRAGDLTGPNPTDGAKRGTKYNVAVDGDGVPVACVATAANVNDTLVFERLFMAAFAVMARIRTVFADKGYDAEHHRDLCRSFGVTPQIHTRGQPPGSGLGQRRWPVERSNAWVLENKRLALRYDRLGFIIQSLLQSACIFLVAGRLASQF